MKTLRLMVCVGMIASGVIASAQESDQGFRGPPRGGHHGGPRNFEAMKKCMEGKNVALPAPPQDGQRPELTEEQRTAMDECRSEIESSSSASTSSTESSSSGGTQ